MAQPPPPKSDIDLLDAWRAGDPRAGNELFNRHFDSVCRFFANKAGNEVDDLIQRTFLACVEGRDRFRGDASFRGYLFGVARNVLHARLQRLVDVGLLERRPYQERPVRHEYRLTGRGGTTETSATTTSASIRWSSRSTTSGPGPAC